MQEAEKDGVINTIQLSGWLSMDVEKQYTKNGKAFLKTELVVPQSRKGAEDMVLGVTMWVNKDNGVAIKEASQFKQGDAVVITGKLTIQKYQYRVYVGIEASSIQ